MKVIGVAGYARAGKDTFVGIAKNILTKNNYRPMRVAFADSLKKEVDQMLNQNGFSIDVYTDKLENKTKLRPLLVWWGCNRRDMTEDGLYWVNVVDRYLHEVVDDYISNGESTDQIVALVSDVRFPNESKWIHDEWEGEVIHLRRYTKEPVGAGLSSDGTITYVFNNKYDPAPNEEESKQDPLVLSQSDLRIEWENKGKLTAAEAIENPYLQGEVLKALNASKFFNGTLSLSETPVLCKT